MFLVLFLCACSSINRNGFDQRFGPPDPSRYDQHADTPAARAEWDKVRPIFSQRCAVCHGCYDSPCQLKLTGYDGLTRGGSKEQVYATRLLAAHPTRLHIDAQTDAEWRKLGFHPVLNERDPTPEANREGSVIYRMLALKRKQGPQPAILSSQRYDFSLDRKQVCATLDEMSDFEREHPDWGMPYGMPQLSEADYRTLTDWVEKGAPYAPPKPLGREYEQRIDEWESFLNDDSLKAQLVSRYIYEHWYLAHLYFDDLPTGEYFDLVRSKTPPGQPIAVIATRSPYDDPGVARVYYRFRRVDETILAKTHMPVAIGKKRMGQLRSWFFTPNYEVTALPSYQPEVATNPFVVFEQLPLRSRYRMMLEEAQFTIMNFIKGPVCRGQVALNVITDYSWVFFLDPDLPQADLGSSDLARALADIRLPSEDDSLPMLRWRRYAEKENEYLVAKAAFLNQRFGPKRPPNLDMLWDGDGNNRNAALTIFRHFDSASVVKGLVGDQPQTAWVIGYPLIERIHYLLVAGYDVYSNASHQLTTRLYMDFLRMEGEANFLTLLPLSTRSQVHDFWYRGATDEVKGYMQGQPLYFSQESGVRYRTKNQLPELYGLLRKRLTRVLDHRYDLQLKGLSSTAQKSLTQLDGLSGVATSHLPEIAFLRVNQPGGGYRDFTLVHNAAHRNVSTLFEEAENRLPAEDTVTLVNGFLGAYPNAFYLVKEGDLPTFVDAVANLQGEPDYAALMARFAVRRTDERFWPHSDALLATYRRNEPIESGLFDFNRYENR